MLWLRMKEPTSETKHEARLEQAALEANASAGSPGVSQLPPRHRFLTTVMKRGLAPDRQTLRQISRPLHSQTHTSALV